MGVAAKNIATKTVAILLTLLALTYFSLAAPPAIPSADPHRYLDDIKALSAPAMEGRGAGSKGLTRAEHLIEKVYKSLGLEPAGTNSYLQPFTVITGAQLKGKNSFAVLTGAEKRELKAKQDFVPFSFSASGSAHGPLVFAGYGISADEFHYDDYAGIDVKDKIVVVLRYEPPSFGEKGGNQGMTQHSQLVTKAINARNHGARALVLVNGKLGDGEEDLLTRFGSVSGPENAGIIFLQVKNDVAEGWLKAAGKSLAELQAQINASSKPGSFALAENQTAALTVSIRTTRATVNNVLAYLPGRTDEYVIIGAHYDHLGRGNFDSLAPSQIGQIHPGADDNASGTAGVLELARLLAPLKGQLRRGILFASFAGEELGLLGSAAWVSDPTRPLDKAVAMLNMDMIGRIKDQKVYIGGVGTGSTLKAVVEQASEKSGFKIEYSPGGYSSSDHTSFVAKKIPVLFFFSGLHSDYHKPSDTWEKVDPVSAVRLLDVVGKTGEELADAERAAGFYCGRGRQAGGRAWRQRLRTILRIDSGFWRGGKRREVLRCETRIARGEGGTEGRRYPGAVRRQTDQESLRLHGCPAPQQSGRCGRGQGAARWAADWRFGQARTAQIGGRPQRLEAGLRSGGTGKPGT